jgi:O-antigen ligase
MLADFVVAALFLAVPLAASPRFWDQFTTVKWYVLEALAVAWFLIELWRCGSCGWPAFVRERWPARACVLLAALMLLGSLRYGVAWALPALLDRECFVLLALSSYWYFRRNEGRMGSIAFAAGAAAGLVIVVGLAQTLGWNPLPFLTAGDQRSAFFGNVNLTAQFLGLAVILVLAGVEGLPRSRARAFFREALVTASLVHLYFLSSRSVFLALGVAFVVLLAGGWLSARSVARMVGAAVAVILLILHFAPVFGWRVLHSLSPEVVANKALSTEMRLAVWGSTLQLIRDHPLGVGSGSFGEAFIPYQLGLDIIPGNAVLFRTPHNEYLRVLAEEGPVFGVVAAVLLLCLLRRLRAEAWTPRWRSGSAALLCAGITFLAVEACFQFPFGTAFGSLMTAVLLGLALARIEASTTATEVAVQGQRHRRRWRVVGTAAVAGALGVLGRVVVSELLFVNHRFEAAAQETACRLNPRNLPACVTAAWLQARNGDRREARALLLQVLQHSPYYHPAIRVLGEESATNGDLDAACLYLWVYDELFRERSAIHARVGALCAGAPPAALPPGMMMPYYGKLPIAKSDAALR